MKANEIAEKAANLVCGNRAETHGNMHRNLSSIALLWNAYQLSRKDISAPLNGVDVAQMMVLLKIARTQSGSLNMDDFIDAAGYISIAGEIAGKQYLR